MSLIIAAIPIGDVKDVSLRVLDALQNTNYLICEDRKEASRFLRAHGLSGKTYYLLNEHSRPEDMIELVRLCRENDCVLISDCGTPVFCDPGAELVRLCRREKIAIKTLPGASSLMALLSLVSERCDQFYFRGFLPANTEERVVAYRELIKCRQPIVLMDTPYRLQKTLDELQNHFCERRVLLGLNLTSTDEQIFEGRVKDFRAKLSVKKAEFIALIYAAH